MVVQNNRTIVFRSLKLSTLIVWDRQTYTQLQAHNSHQGEQANVPWLEPASQFNKLSVTKFYGKTSAKSRQGDDSFNEDLLLVVDHDSSDEESSPVESKKCTGETNQGMGECNFTLRVCFGSFGLSTKGPKIIMLNPLCVVGVGVVCAHLS